MPIVAAPLAVAVIAAAGVATSGGAAAADDLELTTIEGTLANGNPYTAVLPSRWNGTLLLDLDFNTSQSRYQALYERGFAGAGVERAGGAGDAPAFAADLLDVLDVFTEEFGAPEYVLSNGRSRGGVTAAVLMETYPDQIDGAVAQCTVPGYIPSYNSKLDAAFAAQQLLGAQQLAIVDIPTDDAQYGTLVGDWADALQAAQGTPEGKARISLAHVLGQLPVRSSATQPVPDPDDSAELQQAMFETLAGQFQTRLGIRRDYEQAAGGVFNWNDGVDYVDVFHRMVRPELRAVVQDMYSQAGLDLEVELRTLDAAPRIVADPAAVAEVDRRGGHTADPDRPILFNQALGDATTQLATISSYVAEATRNGKQDLVRTTVVDTAGHCAFSTETYVSAVEVVDERVRTGVWPDTSAEAMNERVRAIDEAASRDYIEYEIETFARPFFRGDVYTPMPDTTRPTATLTSPTVAGPFQTLSLRVDATDDRGLGRIVANIYRDGVLVKSTQTAVGGAPSASHLASVALPDGSYTVKYNAQDLAGNTARTGTFAFAIDTTAPTATVKDGDGFTAATGSTYDQVSFKLFDAGKVDKVVVNGVEKNLTDNTWSDVNFLRPGTFGAIQGESSLVVYDVAGNASTVHFVLN
ncbi:hypothetical protein [Microbacterium invictum]|uniref:Pimeloyl-ACP methyl ester carboxylesterase n=1 Tax=Microbacterium invictum TaxID=515415 RepID=A0AA40VNY2_9MICO|nr:hypothetical protein [Microbacterium invictum]MBB4141287.1 pimeloyl-ACP methyl ester carboxylesterase [Microbacterium invictum]